MNSTSIISIMLPAFFECLVLIGIHSYLGLHVLRRKVIFVDLSLAQIAALGTTVGFLVGLHPSSFAAFLFSMAFTFIGAAIFALTRLREEKVPQEAVIGLIYVLAAALVILVIDRSPHGAEHIKEVLTGSILWVTWPTIIKSAIAYSLVGIFHYIFRKQFLLISEDHEKALAEGLNVRFWDFLFYMSFGFVISYSVGVAGVLLVFVFLVAPAITAILITDNLRFQIIIGWILGIIVTMTGLFLSYVLDFPAGPTVVAFYGLALLTISLILYVIRSSNKKQALTHIGYGVIVVILLFFLFAGAGSLMKKWGWGDAKWHHASPHQHAHHAAQKSHSIVLKKTKTNVKKETKTPPNWEEQLDVIQKLFKKDKLRACHKVVPFLAHKELPFFFAGQALDIFKACAEKTFGYDPEAPWEKRKQAIQKMKNWLASHPLK